MTEQPEGYPENDADFIAWLSNDRVELSTASRKLLEGQATDRQLPNLPASNLLALCLANQGLWTAWIHQRDAQGRTVYNLDLSARCEAPNALKDAVSDFSECEQRMVDALKYQVSLPDGHAKQEVLRNLKAAYAPDFTQRLQAIHEGFAAWKQQIVAFSKEYQPYYGEPCQNLCEDMAKLCDFGIAYAAQAEQSLGFAKGSGRG